MSTRLWQAELVCTDGSIRERATLEMPAHFTDRNAGAFFWTVRNWCRSANHLVLAPGVQIKEVAPEDRLPDVSHLGIRGDMCARDAGERP